MVVGDGWLYNHLWKTGGSFLLRYMEVAGLGSRRERQHDGVRHLSLEQRRDNVVFGTIRHPLDWYRSYYRHFHRHGHPEDGVTRFTDKTPAPVSFERWLYLATHPAEADDPLRPLPIVPEHEGHRFATWAAEGGGWATWSYRYVYTVRGEVGARLIDATTDLRPGLVSLFRDHGFALDEEMLWAWNGRVNASPAPPLGAAYTPEMERWVRAADGDYWRTYWPETW